MRMFQCLLPLGVAGASLLVASSSFAQEGGSPPAPAPAAPAPAAPAEAAAPAGAASPAEPAPAAEVSVTADETTPTSTDKKNGVYGDLSLGAIGLTYERVLGSVASIALTAQYYRPWYVSDHVFGFGGELRPFVFLTDDAPNGVYLSPGLRVAYAKAEFDDVDVEGVAWSVKATIGYSVVLANIVSGRIGAGIQSHQADLVDGSREEPDFVGAYPAVDLYLGVVF